MPIRRTAAIRELEWVKNLLELLKFKMNQGHCCTLPQHLVYWKEDLNIQYKLLKQGMKTSLTPRRIKLLQLLAGKALNRYHKNMENERAMFIEDFML